MINENPSPEQTQPPEKSIHAQIQELNLRIIDLGEAVAIIESKIRLMPEGLDRSWAKGNLKEKIDVLYKESSDNMRDLLIIKAQPDFGEEEQRQLDFYTRQFITLGEIKDRISNKVA